MWLLLRHQEHSSQQSRQKSTSSWRSHPDPNGGSLQICSERARYDGDKQSREGDWECSGHGGSFEQSGLERPLLGWSHFSRDLEKARKSGVCVSGGRVSLEERTVSVQASGRQESAWCVSRIAGQWCRGQWSEAESGRLSRSVGQSCETTWGNQGVGYEGALWAQYWCCS